jgi:hypothetical protein
MKRAFGWTVASWVIASAMSLPLVSQAQAHHGGGSRGAPHGGGHRGGYYGRDFHSFGHRDAEVWRGGGWRHDWHDGRFGWWWFVGGYWYLYPEPIYPYPTYVPPAVVVQQAPPVPTGLPPSQFWYYCADPQGYYPYVASCNGAWQPVPATPPGAVTDEPAAPP